MRNGSDVERGPGGEFVPTTTFSQNSRKIPKTKNMLNSLR